MTYPRQRSLWKADGTRRQFFVYIMSNASMTLYTGVTNDLNGRVGEHKLGESGFTSLIVDAIAREKQIKGMNRAKKIALVKTVNPAWHDLSSP